jgi:hypothetical protein
MDCNFFLLGSVFYHVTPISMHHKWPIGVKFPNLNITSIIDMTRLAHFLLIFLKKGIVIGKVDKEETNFTSDL